MSRSRRFARPAGPSARRLAVDPSARTWTPTLFVAPLFMLILPGCGASDEQTPTASRIGTPLAAAIEADHDVWSVFDHRCVVCHACYDAPCQLQLVSHEGVSRGASPDAVYDAKRLTPQTPTRLGVDAQDVPGWRALGFHDVVAGPAEGGDGLMLRMLALGRTAPFEPDTPLPEEFPLAIDRPLECPTAEDFDDYARERPRGGMPYGLAPLADSELARITDWLAAGAPAPPRAPIDPDVAEQVATWERFLNGESLKERITARYLYEHWFVTHLYFASDPTGPFFRAVRSSTPPGEPVREIATRRPYDDPGDAPFWYRLDPIDETIVHKTHVVYEIGRERLARLRALFLEPDWTPTAMPAYGHEKGSNPFETYFEMPARGRYQYLLDDARHFVATFIRGPVCHGQVAVDVIEDHFWIAFLDPDQDLSVTDPEYLAQAKKLLDLPAEEGSLGLPGVGLWADHTANQVRYLRLRRKLYSAIDPQKKGPSLDAIWDGEGHDPDALLTVWRHFDNATVERGLIGGVPETAWIMDYPIFERIYYDLVAGFDVFGNVGHQIATRLYMDHLRMQSENVFLAFVPEAARQPLRDSWYVGAENEVHKRFVNRPVSAGHGTQVQYESDRYVEELFRQLDARSPEVGGPPDVLNRCRGDDCDRSGVSALERRAEAELRRIANRTGLWVRHMPEVTWLRVHADDDLDDGHMYTLVHDRAHTNVASMFGEEKRLQPELDELTIVPGTLGSYPNYFLEVSEGELTAFRQALTAVVEQADFRVFADRFGVRRTSPRFWPLLDWIHADYARRDPLEAGIVDLGRFENH